MEPERALQTTDADIAPPYTQPDSPPHRTNRLMRSKSESSSDKKTVTRSKLQALPEVHSLSFEFQKLAIDSVSRSDSPSSKTKSTDSSSRSHRYKHGLFLTEDEIIKMSSSERKAFKKELIEEKDLYESARKALQLFEKVENTLRDNLLISFIKNADREDLEKLSLASFAVIEPKKLVELVSAELKNSEDLQSEPEALIDFCHRWRAARPKSAALSSVKTEIDRIIALGDSIDLVSKASDEPPLAKYGKKDFKAILSGVEEKKSFSKIIGDIVADLRENQIAYYSQLSITNLDVEHDNHIPVGLQGYVQYCRSITLYTAYAIATASVNQEYILKLFLSIAWRCYREHDFELTGAIWEGLYKDIRVRFPVLWESVYKQKKYKPRMNELAAIFNSNKRFTALCMQMEACQKANKPFIPYLTVTLEKIRDIRSQDAIVIDKHGWPRYNMGKLDALKMQVDRYLLPQKLHLRSDYKPVTNLVATYLKEQQPLTPRDLDTLGFPHLTKEVCLALTPFQRWDLEKRLQEKRELNADKMLALIRSVRIGLRDRALIQILCENKGNVWGLFFLAHESIIKSDDLFALITENLGSVETAIPLLSFCLQSPAITTENTSKIVEITKDHPNGQVRALSKRISDRLLTSTPKRIFAVSTPVEDPVCDIAEDFEIIVSEVSKKSFDLAQSDLARKIATDLSTHLANLYLMLTPEQCISKKWVAGHEIVKKIEQHFNSLTNYLKSTLEKERDPVKQSDLVEFYYLIANKCLEMNDFSNALGFYLVLAPYQEMKELQALFSPLNNYRTLRETTAQTKKAYIPYIGLLLKDLAALEESPSILSEEIDPVYNIEKLAQIKTVLDAFFTFKPALEERRTTFIKYSPYTNLVSKYLIAMY